MPTPSGLSATDEIGRIVVSWQAVDDDNLAGYAVYRSVGSDGTYDRLTGEGTAFTTGRTSYVDSNLAGGALFFYKVQAIGANGLVSEVSSFVGGRAESDESAPGAPQNVGAVADENDPGRITVRWSAPTRDANGGKLTGLTGYHVLRAEGDGALLPVDTLAAAVRTYADTGLKPLTSYRYAVAAFDASQNQGGQGLSSVTRTSGVPTPSGLRAVEGIERVNLTWDTVDSDVLVGYDILRATRTNGTFERLEGVEGTPFTTGRTTYTDSSLSAGDLRFYRVRAVSASGTTSELSATVSAAAQADESAPATPQSVTAVPSTDPDSITVRWTAPLTDANGAARTGLTGFRVLRAEGADGSLVPVATLAAADRQFGDQGLKSLTSYRYAVQAFDGAGNESALSAVAQARTIGVAVPSGVVAEDGIGRISVRWAAVDDDELIGYNVFRSTSPDALFARLDGDGGDAFTTGRTTLTDSSVATGRVYYYRVSAVSAARESERTTFVSATAETDDVAPESPSDLVAIAVDAQGITLRWTGSKSDQGGGRLTGLDGYVVFRGKGSASALVAIDTVSGGTTSLADEGLDAATTYFYTVSAIDGAANVSPRAVAVSATTPGIAAPSSVTALGDIRRITVSWSASGDDDLLGYNVYRSSRSDEGYTRLAGSEGAPFTTGRTSYIDSNLSGGQTVFYRVAVVTAAGESNRSAFDGATALVDSRAPEAPSTLSGKSVIDDPERLKLTWRAPNSDENGSTLTGVSGYTIYRATTADGDFDEVGTATTASFEDTGLEQRTTYYYQVEAVDADGNISRKSSTVSVTTSGVVQPTKVRLVSTTPSDVADPAVVTISWTGSAGAILRYEVQRTTVANSTDDGDYIEVGDGEVGIQKTFDDETVARGTTYYYRVRAVDVELRESDWTDPLAITVSN